MDQISSKTAEVASLPRYRLPLNLQLFAEEIGYPSLEDSPEFKEDAKEFNSKMDKYVEERESKKAPTEKVVEKEPVKEVDKAVTPEVAAPDDKPKQDMETNKAFQEMRQKLEAAEKAKAEVEAKAKRADEAISKQWGHIGVHTVEQYEQRVQQEAEAEDNKRYEEAGLTPEEIEKIRKYDEIQRESETNKATKQQEETTKQWGLLYSSYPELAESSKLFAEGKEPDWFNDEMKLAIANGSSPRAAYRDVHFETIIENRLKVTKESAKQEALNTLNSKNHMKPNGTEGGDVDHVEIDAETMRMYRSLNKGKSDAEIRKFHKQNAGK